MSYFVDACFKHTQTDRNKPFLVPIVDHQTIAMSLHRWMNIGIHDGRDDDGAVPTRTLDKDPWPHEGQVRILPISRSCLPAQTPHPPEIPPPVRKLILTTCTTPITHRAVTGALSGSSSPGVTTPTRSRTRSMWPTSFSIRWLCRRPVDTRSCRGAWPHCRSPRRVCTALRARWLLAH